MTQSRTHNCGELRLADAGKTVTLAGWLENMREVGSNLAFVVLRDFYGTTQVVIESEKMMQAFKPINRESTISVTGVVRERTSKNPKQPTGEIEVVPESVSVLGRCRYNALPFEINRSKEADENQRLKYRYLDLRNPEVKKNIILRSNVVADLRRSMTERGFLEITTPILTSSSPEGARDYLVPARNHPGKFYALPQAPQQFKQLLMTSGFDRYFQIAPCFRDEDARADRSPGEFYQLDMEMAFATQDDVFAVLEDVLPPVFTKYGKYKAASAAPFRRISFRESMDRYGSDKPDLRIDLELTDAACLQDCGFEPFAGQTVKAVVVPDFHKTRKFIDKLCAEAEMLSGGKAYWFRLDENGELEFCHNPFSMPQGGLEALERAHRGEIDPLTINAYQYDLVCNGVELSSGAVRNHDPEIMIRAFELVGLGEADVKAKFPAMYNAFCYGAPPHAGIAPGVDRMVMLLAGEDSIREVIPFPMNKNAQDLMMDAPSAVDPKQLADVHIAIVEDK